MQTCPFRGRRAAEMANNELLLLVESELRTGARELALRLPQDLDAQSRTEVLLGLEAGRSHVMFALSMRLGHWLSSPWRLCAAAHHEPEVARASLAAALECDCAHAMFEELKRGALRDEALAFVAGESTLAECQELAAFVGKLRMIPIAERRVEGLHAQIHKMTTHAPNSSVPYLSFGLRCREIASGLKSQPVLLEELSQHLLAVRGHQVLRELEFQHHLGASGIRKHKHYWPIVYRCDAQSQYGAHRDEMLDAVEVYDQQYLRAPVQGQEAMALLVYHPFSSLAESNQKCQQPPFIHCRCVGQLTS